MSFTALMLDPIYDSEIGTDATLASSAGEVDLRVLDKTAGIVVPDKTLIETIRPACCVRAAELAANGITRDDLAGGTVTLNGQTWAITTSHVRPTPGGEADGEYLLILASED